MKELAVYYYNVSTLWQIDYEQCKYNLLNKIWNHDGYEITKKTENTFFIHLVKKHQFDILPKKWSEKNINSLETIKLEDWESLFTDVFIHLDISCLDLFSNSLGVISVLKWWKEISLSILWKLFQEIYSLQKACSVEPIFFKDPEKYFEQVERITHFSFAVASANTQRTLWVTNSDWLWELFNIKDELWGDSLSFIVHSKEWLEKNKIKWFLTTYKHLSIKPPKITVDEFWKSIKQEIDKIRFKSTVELELENWELDQDIVYLKMKKDFQWELIKIKEEFNYTN